MDAGTPEAPGFQIDLYFDETVPRTVGDRCDRPAIPFIDDMAIVVTVRSLSGSTLARAGPCFVRGSGASAGFPIYGSVEIDDGATGWPYDKAVEILSHEIGHVVGIGTLWDPLILDPCGREGGRAHFGAGNAVREYDAAGGSPPDSLYVQDGSEAKSGLCFPGDHWGYLMASEIMSPSTPVAGAIQPLSGITIGALDHLGWIVDYAEADPFTPRAQGAPLRAPGGDERTDIVARDWRIRD